MCIAENQLMTFAKFYFSYLVNNLYLLLVKLFSRGLHVDPFTIVHFLLFWANFLWSMTIVLMFSYSSLLRSNFETEQVWEFSCTTVVKGFWQLQSSSSDQSSSSWIVRLKREMGLLPNKYPWSKSNLYYYYDSGIFKTDFLSWHQYENKTGLSPTLTCIVSYRIVIRNCVKAHT